MKHFFIQKQELATAEARLETLKERKKRLRSKILSCTAELKEGVISTSITEDKMQKYLIDVEEIDEEIRDLEEEIKCLKNNLAVMQQALEQMEDIKYKIFLYRYKDNLKVSEIARKIYCSGSRVYQLLDEIEVEMTEKTKDYKKL